MYFNEYVVNDLALDSLSTTQTQFFHGVGHLQFIEHHLFPEWEAQAASGSRARHIRIWSMASADGDEPYSLAFALLERFPAKLGWRIQILTTDLSTRAREDSCPSKRSNENSSEDEMAKVGSEVGPIIEFHRVNLNDEISPLGGPFDLIWYRNVLTYFNYQSKLDIVADRALDLQSPARDRSKTRTR